ncbi:MAG: DegT/DnrJ/EryC1/StrS family aminotransferase [Candidatus Woesearchaeota archaeon]
MISIANPIIEEKEKNKVLEVMDSGMLASGQYVKDFEKNFGDYIGTEYAHATSSGTTALHVALKAAGIKEGDKVLTTPFTFIASSNSILFCGAEPVFADIKEDTFNIDPASMKKKLEENPDIKALIVVHLYGLSCDMDAIMDLVEEYNLILIEDAAQSHGASYKDEKVGNFGDAAIFSFYPTKNMTTSEGGMVVTNDKEVSEESKLIINHGATERYKHEVLGYNYRMTNISAAIGLEQLKKLNKYNTKRQENAAYLTDKLSDLDWLKTPVVPENREHVFHQYTVKVDNREEFLNHLEENEIGYGIHYPIPAYKQPLYEKMGYGNYKLEITEKLSKKVVSLPVHPALSDEDLDKIIEVVKSFEV